MPIWRIHMLRKLFPSSSIVQYGKLALSPKTIAAVCGFVIYLPLPLFHDLGLVYRGHVADYTTTALRPIDTTVEGIDR